MIPGYYIIEKAGMEKGFETDGKYDSKKFKADGPYDTIEKANEVLTTCYNDNLTEMVSGYIKEDGTMMSLKEFYDILISNKKENEQ